jgi:hypothetical protein
VLVYVCVVFVCCVCVFVCFVCCGGCFASLWVEEKTRRPSPTPPPQPHNTPPQKKTHIHTHTHKTHTQALTFVAGASGWLSAVAFGGDKAVDDPAVLHFCSLCPEHLVDDLLAVVLYISRFRCVTAWVWMCV